MTYECRASLYLRRTGKRDGIIFLTESPTNYSDFHIVKKGFVDLFNVCDFLKSEKQIKKYAIGTGEYLEKKK